MYREEDFREFDEKMHNTFRQVAMKGRMDFIQEEQENLVQMVVRLVEKMMTVSQDMAVRMGGQVLEEMKRAYSPEIFKMTLIMDVFQACKMISSIMDNKQFISKLIARTLEEVKNPLEGHD